MKLKIFFCVLTFCGITTTAHADASFSCYYREYCYINKYTKKAEDCKGYKENSLFVVNDNETQFLHNTPEGNSTYYIKKKEYSEKDTTWRYDVVSEIGNKYFCIFNPNRKIILVFFTGKEESKTILMKYYVKTVFFE